MSEVWREPMCASEWEKAIGEQVVLTRHRMRLRQVDLAAQANISLSAVKSLEAGRGSSLRVLIGVARALKRSDWLGSLALPEPTISPLALLRAQEAAQASKRQRIRPKKT